MNLNVVSVYDFYIVCAHQSHVNSSIKDTELSIPGFLSHRKDRVFNNKKILCLKGLVLLKMLTENILKMNCPIK